MREDGHVLTKHFCGAPGFLRQEPANLLPSEASRRHGLLICHSRTILETALLLRVVTIALNTYREAVRARVLHGLFALALATAGYCIIVGQFALQSSMRVVSDLGAASVSVYGIVASVVLGATSLYRELEQRTLFPILARPIRRSEYLVGKYVGIWATLVVFVAANAGVLLMSLAALSGASLGAVTATSLGSVAVSLLIAWRSPRARTFVPIPWAVVLAAGGWFLSAGAPDERSVVTFAALLTIAEVGIVTALAMLFSSFSSPFLTAVFTFGVFMVGRSADTLARLPERQFGAVIHRASVAMSKVVPNLMIYVPPRMVLTGESADVRVGEYVFLACAQALAWTVGLLAMSTVIFRRRDFP